MVPLDEYARNEQKRRRAYLDAYASAETRRWIESLSPSDRERAEKLGLLAPRTDWSQGGQSLEQLSPALEPRQEGGFSGGPVARPLRKRLDTRFAFDGWAEAFSRLGDDEESMLMAYLAQDGNPRLRWACVCYLLGLGTCEHFARQLGMSKQAFHYHVRKMEKQLGMPPMANQKSERVRALYRVCNKRRG